MKKAMLWTVVLTVICTIAWAAARWVSNNASPEVRVYDDGTPWTYGSLHRIDGEIHNNATSDLYLPELHQRCKPYWLVEKPSIATGGYGPVKEEGSTLAWHWWYEFAMLARGRTITKRASTQVTTNRNLSGTVWVSGWAEWEGGPEYGGVRAHYQKKVPPQP